jgi:hypothetical protein
MTKSFKILSGKNIPADRYDKKRRIISHNSHTEMFRKIMIDRIKYIRDAAVFDV